MKTEELEWELVQRMAPGENNAICEDVGPGANVEFLHFATDNALQG